MSIYSQWNPENDEAIFSPGDPKPIDMSSEVRTPFIDKALEFDIHGTVLNKLD